MLHYGQSSLTRDLVEDRNYVVESERGRFRVLVRPWTLSKEVANPAMKDTWEIRFSLAYPRPRTPADEKVKKT
jgi:hypothetical protein